MFATAYKPHRIHQQVNLLLQIFNYQTKFKVFVLTWNDTLFQSVPSLKVAQLTPTAIAQKFVAA